MKARIPRERAARDNYIGMITYGLEIPFFELRQEKEGRPTVWNLNHAAKTMPKADIELLNRCFDFLSPRFPSAMLSNSGELDIARYNAHLWIRLLREETPGVFVVGFCRDWRKRPKAARRLLNQEIAQSFEVNAQIMDIMRRRKALTDENALLENQIEWQSVVEDFRKKSMALAYRRMKGGFYQQKPEPIALTAFLEKLFRVAGALSGDPAAFSCALPKEELVTVLDPDCLTMALAQLLSNAFGRLPAVRKTTATVRCLKGMVEIEVKNEGEPIPVRVLFNPDAQRHGKMPETLGLWLACLAAKLLNGEVVFDINSSPVVCTLRFPIVTPEERVCVSPEHTQFYYSQMVNPFGLLPLMMSDSVTSPIPDIL